MLSSCEEAFVKMVEIPCVPEQILATLPHGGSLVPYFAESTEENSVKLP
jgi:hypothetical protein